jgi:hypothetical protein
MYEGQSFAKTYRELLLTLQTQNRKTMSTQSQPSIIVSTILYKGLRAEFVTLGEA